MVWRCIENRVDVRIEIKQFGSCDVCFVLDEWQQKCHNWTYKWSNDDKQ